MLQDFYLWLDLNERIAFVSSGIFSLLCIWGVIFFYPKGKVAGYSGPQWLIVAIWLGFLGNMITSLWWKFTFYILEYNETFDYRGMIDAGNLYFDTTSRALGAVAVYLHFVARHRSIPEAEQKDWTPLAMGLYPNKTSRTYAALTYVKRTYRSYIAKKD